MKELIKRYLKGQVIDQVGETRPYIDPDFIDVYANDIEKLVKNNAVLPAVSCSSLFVIELSDEEFKVVTKKELDEMYKSAIEFDGFLGFSVKGRLV